MKENPVRDVTMVTRINDTNIVRSKDKLKLMLAFGLPGTSVKYGF